ncbi:hypothetical protein ACOZ38_11840 [Sphaerisporangium viridialbum]|uniref:hypothetical protein n=1 Tax=Sphaerisporangium viridialbum TaxID=46189 RepID=UPI003C78F542
MTPTSTQADATRQDVVRALTQRFNGWCLWYGTATGHWWALPPARNREHLGLIEARDPDELAERLWRIERAERHLDPTTDQRVWPRHPTPRPHPTPTNRPPP